MAKQSNMDSALQHDLPASATPAPTQSSAMARAPRLSAGTLTIMLVLMCCIPAITVYALWQVLPPAQEDKLEATITKVGVPDLEYYFDDIAERQDVQDAYIVLTNDSESDWEHIFVKVNHHYDIRDLEVLKAGTERKYLLRNFISRTSARYDLRQIPLRHVRIFAKQMDTGARATLNLEFPDMVLK